MKYGVELRLPYIFHRVHRLCRSLSLSPKIPASRTLPPVAQTTVVVRTSAVAALCIVTRVITLPIASAVVRKPPKIAAVHLSHLTFIQVGIDCLTSGLLSNPQTMRADEARVLLGFPPCFHPTPSQVKAAYRKKVWESHPDLFPDQEKCYAECKFKLISEAYTCLQPGSRGEGSDAVFLVS
ncbi:hypothetical protein U1Q18_040856 [Sarracenia purpurea var. burkii]